MKSFIFIWSSSFCSIGIIIGVLYASLWNRVDDKQDFGHANCFTSPTPSLFWHTNVTQDVDFVRIMLSHATYHCSFMIFISFTILFIFYSCKHIFNCENWGLENFICLNTEWSILMSTHKLSLQQKLNDKAQTMTGRLTSWPKWERANHIWGLVDTFLIIWKNVRCT